MVKYNYNEIKPQLFTEKGNLMFMKIQKKAHKLLNTAGAFTMVNLLNNTIGDGWLMIGCVERLVEINEIREVTNDDTNELDRVFVKF